MPSPVPGMEQHRSHRRPSSYSDLFNLESLTNFQIPRRDDDLDSYSNNSRNESRSSQDDGTMRERSNGAFTNRSSQHSRRRRMERDATSSPYARRDTDSNSEGYEENGISEEYYRSMLGEHLQKYKKPKLKNSSSGPSPSRLAMQQIHKRGHGTKAAKFGDDHTISVKEEVPFEVESSPDYSEADFDLEYGGSGSGNGRYYDSSLDPPFLDIGEGVTYQIPPTYDKLVDTLKLPSYADIRIEEYFLQGTLDLQTLAAMISTDRKFESQICGGLAEPLPEYESLQARLKALSASNSNQKFSLHVCDIGLDPLFIPEGAAGRIRRSILNESGTLQVYYVKVLEKGDTYEIIERSLPKKQIVKNESSDIQREESEKIGKLWANIARRDIPRYQRMFISFHRKRLGDHKRWWEACQREVKVKVSRSLKLMKAAPFRTKKLSRDMALFWKRVDKEQGELRKQKEKEDAEALKRAEEAREAKRQQQRLNFLLSQTELYSHFMQKKPTSQPFETLPTEDGESRGLEEMSAVEDLHPGEEEDPEEAKLKREALRAAQKAVSQQQKITNAFDSECSKLRHGDEAAVAENDAKITGSTNIDLLNPSTMPATSSVQTPEMFRGSLKDYQLKGLQWLVNCYEQGLNGILADEMGLGKTIQAMAFLAHLAEEKNIWGPFLVVAPSSVLNNWAEEISRFCPDLKTLPYWGGLPERGVLRKNINPKRLYRRESGFHILITSYQLLVTDEKYLRRVKWQYMVLDEAQAIKSSNSIRWKTLLSFNCRNRLLLTGTPIQNNMAELWALLHFIMPFLFDSHDQFNEWFSKGIENHAEHGGTLNEHQLDRLHAVLKPFMLRRVKKDVITELTSKTEVTVHCKLSSRQQAFYQAIKNKISLTELLDGSRGHLNEKKIVNLMNIVIQLRKVCNHPELFERNEGSSYLYFAEIPNSLLSSYQDQDYIYYAGNSNPITYKVPKLIYQDIVRSEVMPCSVIGHGIQHGSFEKLFNIFSPENIYQSALPQYGSSYKSFMSDDVFGFSRLINLSPLEVSFLAKCSVLERLLFSVLRLDRQFTDELLDLFMESKFENSVNYQLEAGNVTGVSRMLLLPTKSEASILRRRLVTGLVNAPYEALVVSHEERFSSNIRLLRAAYSFIPRARAPPINAECPDRSFAYQKVEELHHPWAKKLFHGFARTSEFNGPRRPGASHHLIQEIDTELPNFQPVFELPCRIFGSSPPMQSFDPAKMLTDSGKLQTLDILLKRLRAENHRVLLFAQMTKMLDLIEDYMNYRKYKYFRLDGSTPIPERRDMVRDFQNRNDVFVFLLSTRAGGLGINLTAADTVIFYESDWNPTLDLQAMDRAHRLGQEKEVTVYRLICKETVEEKILQRASQKNTVQQLVMTGGHVQGDLLKPEDVFSLLLDDAQLEQKLREAPLLAKERQKKKRAAKGIRVDADGDVTLEELTNPNAEGGQARVSKEGEHAEQGDGKTANKKRKPTAEKETRKLPNLTKGPKSMDIAPMDESSPNGNEEETDKQPRPKKRPKRSVNENLEPAVDSADSAAMTNYANQQSSSYYGTPGE